MSSQNNCEPDNREKLTQRNNSKEETNSNNPEELTQGNNPEDFADWQPRRIDTA
jgi:hypothetical protein